MTRKLIVTGAAGGIGTALIRSLRDQFIIVAVDNLSSGSWSDEHLHSNITLVNADITNRNDVAKLPWDDTDFVIHLAATSSLPTCQLNPANAYLTNTVGTVLLADFARRYGVRGFLNSSTSAIYEASVPPFYEDRPISPHLVYSLTKAASEDFLAALWRDYGYPTTSLRFFNVFGPFQDFRRKSPPLINYLVRELLNNNSPVLHANGEQLRDYISIDDVVGAITCVIASPGDGCGVYNICSGVTLSVQEIVSVVQDAIGVWIPPTYRCPELLWEMYEEMFVGPYPLRPNVIAEETNKYSLGNSLRFRQDFAWSPRTDVKTAMARVAKEAAIYISRSLESKIPAKSDE